jgi:hypothetical protein
MHSSSILALLACACSAHVVQSIVQDDNAGRATLGPVGGADPPIALARPSLSYLVLESPPKACPDGTVLLYPYIRIAPREIRKIFLEHTRRYPSQPRPSRHGSATPSQTQPLSSPYFSTAKADETEIYRLLARAVISANRQSHRRGASCSVGGFS